MIRRLRAVLAARSEAVEVACALAVLVAGVWVTLSMGPALITAGLGLLGLAIWSNRGRRAR